MTFQAIETRYLGPTNYRGSRIKAYAFGGSVTVPFDYGVPDDVNHLNAAFALVEKMGWGDVRLFQGGNVKGDGYFFVRSNKA